LLARKELMVLATGGGIVSEPLTFDLILSSFYTIWLKAEPEEHMARVRRRAICARWRTIVGMVELRTILRSREPLYARASAVVDTAGLTVDDAAARLIDAVAPVLHARRACSRGGERYPAALARQRSLCSRSTAESKTLASLTARQGRIRTASCRS